MIVAFTGTRNGMSDEQRATVEQILADIYGPRRLAFHGCCRGADADFHAIARRLGFFIVGFPGKPEGHTDRALLDCDELLPVASPLQRNRAMVEQCHLLIATPFEPDEQAKGGTWATWRMAREMNRGRRLVLPDGTIAPEWGQRAEVREDLRLSLATTPTRARLESKRR